MVQISILSGKQAGTQWVARRFPFSLGRAPGNDLRLEEPGVWDRHLVIDLKPGAGFVCKTLSQAALTLQGRPVTQAVLRNGDLLEMGALKLRFGLSAVTQKSLHWRERLIWAGLGFLTLGQVALIYWLMQL